MRSRAPKRTIREWLSRIDKDNKDPMEGAVKVAIKAGDAETKAKTMEGEPTAT